MPAQKQRSYAEKWRRANKPAAAAKARRFRAKHKGYSTKYVAKARGTARLCRYWILAACHCRNLTRHESGLCWRHRARAQAIALDMEGTV